MGFGSQAPAFEQDIRSAIAKVKTVLDQNRVPKYATEVNHTYDDKFLLAEFVTNTAVAAQITCLEHIGLSAQHMKQLQIWAADKKRVVLRFSRAHECAHHSTEEENKLNPTSTTMVKTDSFGGCTGTTFTTSTKVTKYLWEFTGKYSITAFTTDHPSQHVTLQSRTSKVMIKTYTKGTPEPNTVLDPVDVEITWLMNRLDTGLQLVFHIDRLHEDCHTPFRNNDVQQAIEYFSSFCTWCTEILKYFSVRLFPIEVEHDFDLSLLNDSTILNPVAPVLIEEQGKGVVLNTQDLKSLFHSHGISIKSKLSDLSSAFQKGTALITMVEATLSVMLIHTISIAKLFVKSVESIEEGLREQLCEAIGTTITPEAFREHMSTYNRRVYKEQYAPKPFSYSVRCRDHHPEGVVSIEYDTFDKRTHIMTSVHEEDAAGDVMHMPLTSSCKVLFTGEKYIHSFINHTFSCADETLTLCASARQFSGYILFIGKLGSGGAFLPSNAVIVQNKDEYTVVLQVAALPTAKQFRDAIASLSPEQRAFAETIRSMQLQGSLFSLCIIHIKPLIEKLLNLPPDSLTKKIRLTQKLMDLFIRYQIPSDLVAYKSDGHEDTASMKVKQIEANVDDMFEMIDASKEEEIKEAAQERELDPPPVQSSFSFGGAVGASSGNPQPSGFGFGGGAAASSSCGGGFGFGSAAPPTSGGGFGASAEAAKSSGFGSAAGASSGGFGSAARAPTSGGSFGAAKERTPAATAGTSAFVGENVDTTAEAVYEGGDAILSLPSKIDKRIGADVTCTSLHPATIRDTGYWRKKSQKRLLGGEKTCVLSESDLRTEKTKAYDLLDALTKSGLVPVEDSVLHVIVPTAHTFDQTIMDTLIKKNENPILSLQHSTQLVSSVLHRVDPQSLLKPEGSQIMQ
eukprot:TRINITY_DN9323_c0_g1_i1.p1 TRINITY_DN9323_c0_g1~~TRINITY_DN9323_c0_g1_i1.p1  ORF type:complete len:923 (+),score=203.05 TRINITY_DN9323_c0_g1_i1:51-2771(+)